MAQRLFAKANTQRTHYDLRLSIGSNIPECAWDHGKCRRVVGRAKGQANWGRFASFVTSCIINPKFVTQMEKRPLIFIGHSLGGLVIKKVSKCCFIVPIMCDVLIAVLMGSRRY